MEKKAGVAMSTTPSGHLGLFILLNLLCISSFSEIMAHSAPSSENSPRYSDVCNINHTTRSEIRIGVCLCVRERRIGLFTVFCRTLASQYRNLASIRMTARRHCHLCPNCFLPPILRMFLDKTSPADSTHRAHTRPVSIGSQITHWCAP